MSKTHPCLGAYKYMVKLMLTPCGTVGSLLKTGLQKEDAQELIYTWLSLHLIYEDF